MDKSPEYSIKEAFSETKKLKVPIRAQTEGPKYSEGLERISGKINEVRDR